VKPRTTPRWMTISLYRSEGKRWLDIAVALAVLLVCLPVAAMAAVLVWATMGRPVLFRQTRPGLHGQPFTLLKFRTMTEGRDPWGQLLPDGERLTALGRVLRRLSIDEIPQLINVLGGDMSLVGPRPLLMRYLDRYTPAQARRHDVMPGITGLAQVWGRNTLDWERRFALDVQYVHRLSFVLDLQILLLTVWRVLTQKGISAPNHATAEEFTGVLYAPIPPSQDR
jgi:sugar transferase EpsL